MQRPKCEAGIPDYLVCKSIHCKQCSKKDRECWEWLHGLTYAGADVVYCAHCRMLCTGVVHKDRAGELICGACSDDLRHAKCPTCGLEFEPSAQRPKLDGVMYCSLDCLPLEDGQEAHGSKDPKSRYYDQGGLEVIDVIRAKLTPEQWRGYLLGNLIKYSCRANWKGDFERDVEKMKYYSGYLVGEK